MTVPAHSSPPARWGFWPLQFCGWFGLALFSFPIKLYFLGSWQTALLSTVLREGLSFLLTLAIHPLYRRVYATRPIKGHVSFYIALIAGVSVTASGIDAAHMIAVNYSIGSPHMGQGAFLLGTFCYRIGLFCCWSILYFGIRLMQDQHYREIAWRDAEIRVLRAQINPHFFFNALNTIEAQKQPEALSRLVQDLAAFLRYSLRFRSNDLVQLADEYEAAVHYLAIEKARFREGLEVTTRLDPQAAPLKVPGIVIQPLLENAVKYGRCTSSPPLKVDLDVKFVPLGEVEITVRNSGQWLPPDAPHRRAEGGVGLENLRRRLETLYGSDFSLKIGEVGGNVEVKITLPAKSLNLP